MTPEDALQLVLSNLENHQIHYMVTGSFASNMHGVPRTTYDADIVVDVSRYSLERFLQSLGDDFYVSHEAAKEALKSRRMFNVIHLETGFKLDLIIKKTRPFSEEEFTRREQVSFLDQQRWFASAEDVILSKLEWSKQGESEKQYIDALNIAKVQGDNLAVPYLKKWARDLDVHDLLEKLIQQLSPPK